MIYGSESCRKESGVGKLAKKFEEVVRKLNDEIEGAKQRAREEREKQRRS